MTVLGLEPWEPEETIGKLWHAFASRLEAPLEHAEAAVELTELEARLGVFFRGLGGVRHAEIRASAPEAVGYRRSWRRTLATDADRLARPSFDGETLRLPDRIAEFPDREANAALYFWLTAAAAHAQRPEPESDTLRRDIRALQAAAAITTATLAACPGLRSFHTELQRACLGQRTTAALPPVEAAVEAVVVSLLGGPPPVTSEALALARLVREPGCDFGALAAPKGYRPFRLVALWPDLRGLAAGAGVERAGEDAEARAVAAMETKVMRARRAATDQVQRNDSLVVFRFEALFSWAEFFNLNRRVEDDDEDTAKKAADDHDELTLGQVAKKAATRLKLHLDLAPEDVDRERLAGVHLYPEWEQRRRAYLPDHCRVLASPGEAATTAPAFTTDPAARRRIRAVERQFEALRPKRVILPRQLDGDELDLEATIASRVDLRATGEGSDQVYRCARTQERDLAVAILLDVSRSTESAVGERSVIDVEKEALAALAWGLEACGDDFAIHAFSSLKRDRVYVRDVKDFTERMGPVVEARLDALKPGFYTRLGAAVRHVSAGLQRHPRQRRLLLVITDGKPNDLDHYEGQHGIEDSRMAIHEARRRGQTVHGVVVESQTKAWFARIFGKGGYSVITEPAHLTQALPAIYRRLVGA